MDPSYPYRPEISHLQDVLRHFSDTKLFQFLFSIPNIIFHVMHDDNIFPREIPTKYKRRFSPRLNIPIRNICDQQIVCLTDPTKILIIDIFRDVLKKKYDNLANDHI